MQTWVVPFIFLSLLLGVYLFTPEEYSAPVRERLLKHHLNLFLICELVLVVLSIAATLTVRRMWIDYLAWTALAGAGGLSLACLFGKDRL